MITAARIFPVSAFARPPASGPIRSVVLEMAGSAVVVWHVLPGQKIAAHIHPHGQDTWTVLSGSASYFLGNGAAARLQAGDIAIARPGEVHGAWNDGESEPFIFVSVVAPGNAGFALAGE